MKKETYYCDKCKKQVNSKDDLYLIEIRWGDHNFNTYTYNRHGTLKLEICVSCSVKAGMIKQVVKEESLVNEPQSLGDRLYDVVTDLVHEIHGEVDHG